MPIFGALENSTLQIFKIKNIPFFYFYNNTFYAII